jgi:hypothetical protein
MVKNKSAPAALLPKGVCCAQIASAPGAVGKRRAGGMLWHLFYQAVQKRPSAALRSSWITAAYKKYALFRMISHALHLSIFEQSSL